MASIVDVNSLRLKIQDPKEIIGIEYAANEDSLPESPRRKVAYLLNDTGDYVVYDFETGEWVTQDLSISDTVLAGLIDIWGVTRAAPRAMARILASLGSKMYTVKATIGPDSFEYSTLSELYKFYHNIYDLLEEEQKKERKATTGRYLKSRR